MQVLEVYFNECDEYFFLSRGVVDYINRACWSTDVKLDEATECSWAVSAAQLRDVLRQSQTLSDSINLTRLILAMDGNVRLCGTSWQETILSFGAWHDLKPKVRERLEEEGLTDCKLIIQGV